METEGLEEGARPGRSLTRVQLATVALHQQTRCAAPAFAIGLYESRCPDLGRADGPLVFRSSPCPRAALPTPPSSRARTSPDWNAQDIVFAAT